ncbi:hypothetical protein ELE36_08845 [Pseudolysobacter antarcticus]|uniref:Uncharacterized protein n=1 Tax=Pseudolysobacter antarcticus TaxID=2511995 RepID=A0A411HJ72_9GAMM|nr:hypothetical protein [Pseudolysobacter antarcticus]QBB70464.1 hypothetical protein ELE36_08845 [Pseudolysobacter antarcticus]
MMISAIPLLALAAVLAQASGHSAETYHVFELAAPAEPGLYRLRPSEEMLQLWSSEELQALLIFDAEGAPLFCESIRSLALSSIRKTYKLQGKWLDDETAWSLPSEDGFAFNSIWRFDVPTTSENEFPLALRFNWRSTLNNPGDLQLVTGNSEARIGPRLRTSLLDGQRNITEGHVYLYVGQNPPAAWPPISELRFSITPDEMALDSPILETAMRRPWVHELAWDKPGWYIFHANGKTPYRVQIGRTQNCQGLAEDRALNIEDPNWPAEVTVTRQIINAPRLGK